MFGSGVLRGGPGSGLRVGIFAGGRARLRGLDWRVCGVCGMEGER